MFIWFLRTPENAINKMTTKQVVQAVNRTVVYFIHNTNK